MTAVRAVDNILTSSGVQGLFALLKACTFINELDLHNNRMIGSEAAEQLGEMLHPRNKLGLTKLNLASCPIKVSATVGRPRLGIVGQVAMIAAVS